MNALSKGPSRSLRSGFALRQFDLFQGMSKQWVDDFAQRCSWSSVEDATLLMSQTVGRSDVVFVVSGMARVCAYVGDGKEVIIGSIEPGALFTYPGCSETGSYLEAVAHGPTVVARLPLKAFMQDVNTEPALVERVVGRLVSRMFTLVERVVDLSTLTVGQRLEVELLRLAHATRGAYPPSGAPIRLTPAPRHAELASRIATNREQVTRELNRLVRGGLVAKDGKSLVIADLSQLEQRVGSSRGLR